MSKKEIVDLAYIVLIGIACPFVLPFILNEKGEIKNIPHTKNEKQVE